MRRELLATELNEKFIERVPVIPTKVVDCIMERIHKFNSDKRIISFFDIWMKTFLMKLQIREWTLHLVHHLVLSPCGTLNQLKNQNITLY
ncbi:hypothetical protein CJ030_MR3G011102 [Morella rubra]|uniref:Uncharacterized protein n=1 Tax=Morella rubra TaxID=262757 RepID=A0A6A1W7G3_9ROSI|nr:hypothetical protein CJ030_MR3G011102 [Morella rubra]